MTRKQAVGLRKDGERTAAANRRSRNAEERDCGKETQPGRDDNISESLGSSKHVDVDKGTVQEGAAADVEEIVPATPNTEEGDGDVVPGTPNVMATECERTIFRRHDDEIDILEESNEGKLPSLGLLSGERMGRLTNSNNSLTGGRQDEVQLSRAEMDEGAMGEGQYSHREGSMKDIILNRSPCSSRRRSMEAANPQVGIETQACTGDSIGNDNVDLSVPKHGATEAEGRPPQTNASVSFVDELSESYQAQLLKAIHQLSDNMTKHMGGLCEDMKEVKNALLSKEAASAAADKKGKNASRMESVEDMLSEKLPGFRTAFNKGTFCAVIFGQIVRLVMTSCKGSSSIVNEMEKLTEIIMFSSKDGKSAYETDIGKGTKTLRRAIVNISISNGKADTYGMFRQAAAGNTPSQVPKWLNDASICDLSFKQIEIGCARHEQKAERAAARRLRSMVRGEINPSNSDLGQFVGHSIYGSVMDMFVFGRKNSRIVMFEEVGYLLRNWEGLSNGEIGAQSLKMQWKAAAKSIEMTSNVIPYATTIAEAAADVDEVNRLKFKKVVEEQEHLQLMVSHDVMLRERAKDSQETTETEAAANPKTWKRTMSFIDISLRYLSSFANVEKKSDATTFLKYDKYSIKAAYRLAVALRRIVDVKMNCQIRSVHVEGGHASSCTAEKAAATADEVRSVDKVYDLILTPSTCEIRRVFEKNVNSVNNKVYEEMHDDGLIFMEDVDAMTGGRLTMGSSMNDDLEEQ